MNTSRGLAIKEITARKCAVMLMIIVFVSSSGQGIHTGVGGDANNEGEVAIAGCTCHAAEPDNSVTVILEGIPYHYEAGVTYPLRIQLIGGPSIDDSSRAYCAFLIITLPVDVNSHPVRPCRDGITQSNISIPRRTPSNKSSGSPTPMR